MQKIAKHIAQTLKSLRLERGWSLDKTAQQTSVSKAMLGQIEREESSPTIATLWKIANGFDLPFSLFVEREKENFQKPQKHTNRKKKLFPADEKFEIAPIFPFDKELNCEFFLIKLLPCCEHLSLAHLPGVIEHVIVIEGTLEILINDVWHKLHKGEGLRFKANNSHGYRNTTTKSAYAHNIIHYPKKS